MSEKRPIILNDPGNAQINKPVSVRLLNIHSQWLNLGDKQLSILAGIIASAEALEDRVRELEDAQRYVSQGDKT